MHLPQICKPKPKVSSAALVAEQLVGLINRWGSETASVIDPAGQLRTAKSLQQLVSHLGQQKSICRRGEVRTHLQKQLTFSLLTSLLGSSHDEAVSSTLHALLALSCLLPAVVPLELAPRLLQLVCSENNGTVTAKLLTQQLSCWRFSQLWPYWISARMTSQSYQLLQQYATLMEQQDAANRGSSKVVDACVSMTGLLARLMELSAQQVVTQLANDVDTATRWLQVLLRVGRQQPSLAASAASIQLHDSTCQLLAGMSQAQATTVALEDNAQLRGEMLLLLHRVLRRPCSSKDAASSHIQCWMHAATAASLPVLWQQQQLAPESAADGALELHKHDQLLADFATSAAGTFCNECSSSSSGGVSGNSHAKLEAASANLLAAALLPVAHPYGSNQPCCSRFMAPVLRSGCCHVLLHALAAAADSPTGVAAGPTTAVARYIASSSTCSRPVSSLQPAAGDSSPQGSAAADVAAEGVVPVAVMGHQLQPVWLLLRMICAQCAAAGTLTMAGPGAVATDVLRNSGSDSDGNEQLHKQQQSSQVPGGSSCRLSADMVQVRQVHRVVQAYSSLIAASPSARPLPRLLSSLHVLLCQAALPEQSQAAEKEHESPLQHMFMLGPIDSGSNSSQGDNNHALHRIASLLHALNALHVEASDQHDASSLQSSSVGHQHLASELVVAVYVALSTAMQLKEAGATASMASREPAVATVSNAAFDMAASHSSLALQALSLAAAALKLLLPALLSDGSRPAATIAAEASPGAKQKHRQQQVGVIHEAVECSLAALQALVLLSKLLPPALPALMTATVGGRGSSCSGSNSGSIQQVSYETATAVRTAVTAAATALDGDLQQLLAEAVVSWQGKCGSSSSSSNNVIVPGSFGCQSGVHASIQAALHEHIQQELQCWAAAALASCYGQLGASSLQGKVLAAFRQPEPPFANVQLHRGDTGNPMLAHAAILAAGCPVLGQQLDSAAAAAAAVANGAADRALSSSAASQQLVIKLSAAVDDVALCQALDYIYTGAVQVADAGLASQLQLCSNWARQALQLLHQPQPLVAQRLQHHIRHLVEQQQSAGQQLQKLGLLARKLKVPLLAALCRGRRPQPGQQLPKMHPDFAALLPGELLLHHLDHSVQQQEQQQQAQDHDQQQQARQQIIRSGHESCAAYVSMLAELSNGTGPMGAMASQMVVRGLQRFAGFADALLAAPAVVQTSCLHESFSSQGSSGCEQQQQQVVMLGLLPAQQVLLSGCCPYFDALLSARWQLDSIEEAMHDGAASQGAAADASGMDAAAELHSTTPECSSSSSGMPPCAAPREASSPEPRQQQQLGKQQSMRVVTVPEADIHVAAALQHYLHTGRLSVQLPSRLVATVPAAGCQQLEHPYQLQVSCVNVDYLHSAGDVVFGKPALPGNVVPGASRCQGQVTAAIRLSGCCEACHAARTLLRLWHCAELLLLSELQALCLRDVEAAAWQLDISCCLVLLDDCWELGVQHAATSVAASLIERADKDAAIALPEWSQLQPGLHESLIRAWMDKRRQHQATDVDSCIPVQTGVVSDVPAGVASAVPGADTPQPHSQGPVVLLLAEQRVTTLMQAATAFAKLARSQLKAHGQG